MNYNKNFRKDNPNFKFDINKTVLYKEYIKNVKSLRTIAIIFKCSTDTIRRNLIKYNIPLRRFGEGKIGIKCKPYNRRSYKGKNNPFYGKIHTKEVKEIIRKAQIGRIKMLKERIKLSLSHGGTGIPRQNNLYPIDFIRIRSKILDRDSYICQICHKKGNEVHHIDYNKGNNKETNLIVLCHKCNIKTNFNRDYWYAYCKYIMEVL